MCTPYLWLVQVFGSGPILASTKMWTIEKYTFYKTAYVSYPNGSECFSYSPMNIFLEINSVCFCAYSLLTLVWKSINVNKYFYQNEPGNHKHQTWLYTWRILFENTYTGVDNPRSQTMWDRNRYLRRVISNYIPPNTLRCNYFSIPRFNHQ